MDYEENNFSENPQKNNTSLIITIVCAIIIIAGAAWFAISRYNRGGNASENMSDMKSDIKSKFNSVTSDIESDIDGIASDIQSEYEDITSSYNDDVSKIESEIANPSAPTKPTGDNVSSVPYEAPVYSMPVSGKIIKGFSGDTLQYSKTFGDMRLHSGIDIAAEKNNAVSAAGNGKVLTVEESNLYGTVVTIDLGDGITVRYASLDNLKIKQGDTVKAGDIIGTVTTVPGECNDPEHLHFEVYKNGVAADPLKTLNLK